MGHHYRLVGRVGDNEVALAVGPETTLLGAARGCDIRLDDATVSRYHAQLCALERGLEVVDLGSKNGTFVGRRRLSSGIVAAGSELRFGVVRLRVETIDDGDRQLALSIDDEASKTSRSSRSAAITADHDPAASFLFRSVPRTIELVAEGPNLARAALRIGHDLYDTLPVCRVSVTRCDDGEDVVLFEAEANSRACKPVEQVVSRDGLALSCCFFDQESALSSVPVVETAHDLLRLVSRLDQPPPDRDIEAPPLPEPATVNDGLRRLYDEAARIAQTNVGALITGESGTGKELLARYIHDASQRAGGPFVTINCAALPRDLLEAELFGIEGGVATGVAKREGKFELADGGTLFLDEIGDMALETQAMILRTLQEGEVYRIGSGGPRRISVRVVAATNKNVCRLMEDGRFREDLFFRVATWKADVPPLRHRPEDLPNLAAFFLAREARRLRRRVRGVSRSALDHLLAYDWPGNVRQLENEMGRVVAFIGNGGTLESHCLSPEILAGPSGLSSAATLENRMAAHERLEILAALSRCGGDTPAAARLLGLPKSTLYRRMRILNIRRDPPGHRQSP